MERALINVPFTTRMTVYSGSSAIDPTPDTATIQVIRADGTDLVPAGSATINDATTGPGVFAFNFTAAQMDRLDVLECRWTVNVDGGTARFSTIVEVAGGYLCTLAAMKAAFPSSTDIELAQKRVIAEQNIENACGRAFVPRLAIERRQTYRYMRLVWPNVRAIRAIEVDDRPLSLSELDSVWVTAGGRLMGVAGAFSQRLAPISVAYEHGDDFVPEPVRTAAPLIAQQLSASSTSADVNADRIIRREADNQVIAYASPTSTSSTTTSSASTLSPLLNQIIRDYRRPLVG